VRYGAIAPERPLPRLFKTSGGLFVPPSAYDPSLNASVTSA
jgi:hypothetical protein